MRKTPALLLVLGAGLLWSGPLAAQQFEQVPKAKAEPAAATQTTAPGAGAKIAIINIQMAMAQTQEGKKAAEDLQARFGPRQSEIQKLQEEIRNMENQLRSQERTLSDEARGQLVRDLEAKRKQLTRAQQDLQDDAEDAQNEHINRIGQKMQRVIDRYSRENNLALILNASPGGPIIQWSPAVDITDEIIRLYDQTYPVQASGESKPPAAARSNQPPKQ